MKGFFILVLWTASTALADKETKPATPIDHKIAVVQRVLATRGVPLRAALGRFFADVVRCFENHPQQARNHEKDFPACLARASWAYAAKFPAPLPEGVTVLPPVREGASPLKWSGKVKPLDLAKVKRLDEVAGKRTDGVVGSIYLALGLIDHHYDCVDQASRSPAKDYRLCLYHEGWYAARGIVELNGPPGSSDSPADLSFTVREEQTRGKYVARFGDLGKHFPGMPGVKAGTVGGFFKGLPKGQHPNRNIPKLAEPDLYKPTGHKFLDRMMNKVIGDLLVGKAIFGDYQQVWGP